MRSAVLSSLVALLLAAGTARAADTSNGVAIQGCLEAASRAYHVPPAILVILLNVEGGSLGAVSQNTNGTVDIGPMQVNQIWVPQVAAHWSTTKDRAYRALRDNFCANLEAGAWILRQGLDEAHGDFWEGVGYYHSHDPGHKQTYLRSVLQQVLRLRPHQPADLRSVAQQIIPLLPYRPAALATAASSGSGMMMAQPHPRAAWPSNDDMTVFNLIVIVLGAGLGSYLLWTHFHAEISAAVIAWRHQEIRVLQLFTDRFDLADAQMRGSDPAGVTLRDLYGISHAIGRTWRLPATVLIVVLGLLCMARNAPSQFRRQFDLNGLIREQATVFTTTAAFVKRQLRLVPPAAGSPRPADYALSPAEWIARNARAPTAGSMRRRPGAPSSPNSARAGEDRKARLRQSGSCSPPSRCTSSNGATRRSPCSGRARRPSWMSDRAMPRVPPNRWHFLQNASRRWTR